MTRHIALILLTTLAASPLAWGQASQPATVPTTTMAASAPADLTQELKLIQELYGANTSKARATAQPADDIALARQMLAGSGDSANPENLRYALALEAMKLVLPLGTEESARTASEALALAVSIKPMADLQRLGLERDIAVTRFTRSGQDRLAPAAKADLAQGAVESIVAYADALTDAADLSAGRAELMRAQDMAQNFGLADLREAVAERLRQNNLAMTRQGDLDQAFRSLQSAEESKNAGMIKSANYRLAILHLQYDGEILAAAPFFAKSDHPSGKAVATAAAFLDDSTKVKPDELVGSAEGLAKLADTLKGTSQKNVAAVGVRMLDTFLADSPTGTDAPRARLLLARLQQLAGQGEQDKYLQALRQSYDGLEGRISVLNLKANVIRVEYHFDSRKEMADFVIDNPAAWAISARGSLVGQVPSQMGKTPTRAESKLVFDIAKPLRITFRASGPHDLTMLLFTSPDLPFAGGRAPPYTIGLGTAGNTSSMLVGPGGRPFVSPQMKITPGAVYQESVVLDGKGNIGWTVNGMKITDWASTPPARMRYIRPAFQVMGGPTAYDDITLEGTVLPGPIQPIAAPAATPTPTLDTAPAKPLGRPGPLGGIQ